MEKDYRVYVLQNSADRYYIGLSENIDVRLAQHNAGLSKWTAKYRPWTLIWQSPAMTLSSARQLENLLKRQKGGEGFFKHTGLQKPGL